MKNNKPISCFLIFFIFSIICLHIKSYNKYPTGTHTWSQSEHYAIALNFLDNDSNLFHPASFSLTTRLPDRALTESPTGITAADCPIPHYTAAILMKLFQTSAPGVFRFSSLIWSFLAIFIFFNTIRSKKNILLALGCCGFIMYQPMYCYYQNGFIPSITAFNFFLIGCSLIIRYFEKGKEKLLLFGLLFLILAALIRFTQIISLLSLFCVFFLNSISTKKITKQLFYIAFSIGIVLGYFLFNEYLRHQYGSLFLSRPLPRSSFSALLADLFLVVFYYLRGFLPFVHLFVLGLLLYLFNKQKDNRLPERKNLKYWMLFQFAGAFLFTIIMSKLMAAHDYYAFDTWFPLLIMLIIYLIYRIDFSILPSSLIRIVTIFFLVGSFSVALESQIYKYKKVFYTKSEIILKDFQESAPFLDKHCAMDKKLLLIGDPGLNSPMIGWQRKVYRISKDFDEQIPIALTKNYDIIITHDASFKNDNLCNYADFCTQYQYLVGNSKVSIWNAQ